MPKDRSKTFSDRQAEASRVKNMAGGREEQARQKLADNMRESAAKAKAEVAAGNAKLAAGRKAKKKATARLGERL